jgi:hypothetical protein
VEVEMTTTIIPEEMLPLLKQLYQTMLWEEAYKLQRERIGLLSIEQAFEKVKENRKEIATSQYRKIVEEFAKQYPASTMALKFRLLEQLPTLEEVQKEINELDSSSSD